MPSTRNLVRVFLASPGDLAEERQLAKSLVDEFNANNSDFLNYQVELLGWEDTVSQQGRAQAVINRDLLKCDLFVGLMWKRWGTPPDNTGRYTSGFEEEYKLAAETLKASGRPDMKMYFKRIEPSALSDPGEGLRRVLSFQADLISGKEIYYETFDDIEDFRRRFTRAITTYVHELFEKDRQQESATSTSTAPASSANSEPPGQGAPLEVDFLRSVANVLGKEASESLNSVEVARLRTIAASLSRSGNDIEYVGVHDANIVFSNRKSLTISSREQRTLIDTALANHTSKTFPLFYWLSTWDRQLDEYLSVAAWVGQTDAERVGAIEAMRLLSIPIDEGIANGGFWADIFSHDTPSDVKVAALRYLRDLGTKADLPLIVAELEKSNYATVSHALGAAATLLLRYDAVEARDFLLGRQFGTIDPEIASTALVERENLTIEQLRGGAAHRSNAVRLWCLEGLLQRGALTTDEITAAQTDASADIRYLGARVDLAKGKTFTKEEAKAILVKPTTTFGLSMGSTQADEVGETLLEVFMRDQYKTRDRADLEAAVESSNLDSGDAYFALATNYFSEYVDELRKAATDRFVMRYGNVLAKIERALGPSYGGTLIDDYKRLSDFVRKSWTRRALDILIQNDDRSAIDLIRQNIRDEFAGAGVGDIRFMQRHGNFSDIPLIVMATSQYVGRTISPLWYDNGDKLRAAATAILKLGKGRLPEVLQSEMGAPLLVQVFRQIGASEFLSLSDSLILNMLSSKQDSVREVLTINADRFLTKKRLLKILSEYEALDSRYYNVIYWLDLGASFPARTAKAAAKRALADL